MLTFLAFTPHPNFALALAIGEATLRPKLDLFDLSDLPEGKDVVENVV